MPTYASTLRRYRLRARLSQNALAHRVGLDASYLNRLESGVRGAPSYDVALTLARELARSADELDRLLFAAGYLSPRLQQLGPDDSTLAAVLAVLADDRLSLEARADFRAVVETVAGRWARDARGGSTAPRRGYVLRTTEKPGVAPGVLAHLLGNTVFLRLGDVAADLPPYSERVVRVPLDRDHAGDPDVPSQAAAYRRLADDLRRAVVGALAGGSKRLLGAYLQSLLAYPDGCIREETVLDPETAEVVASAPALPTGRCYPKERALVDLLRRERRRGRRTLVFVTHTETRDLTPRLTEIIGEAGLRAAVLKANTVAPAAREAWVEARVKEGIDTLICHPRLVQTGLDLLAFPSIVWLQPDYSVVRHVGAH